jgi:formate-dependent nitrite reductase cytochrome c552 subunit
MLHNEFIIADLAFRDCARGRPDEQDFYETHGKASIARPAVNRALAAVRAAFRRLGKEARHLHVGSRAHTAAHSA